MRNLTEILAGRYGLAPFSVRDISFVPELGIIVSFISKNASSYLKTYISCLARNKPFSHPKTNPHTPANTGFQSAEQLGHNEMSRLLTDPSIPKVVVGRHPVSRLLSAFSSRVSTWHREVYDSYNRAEWFTLRQTILGTATASHAVPAMAAISQEISWSDLVDHVLTTPAGQLDRHLVPQTFFAGTDLISYDLVGSVEHLDTFIQDLCELTGKKPLDDNGRKINASPNSAKAMKPPQVSDDQRQALQRRYEADYEFFGYHLT